jgi:hypothetical protein
MLGEGCNHGRRKLLQGVEYDVKGSNMPMLNIATGAVMASNGKEYPEAACATKPRATCGKDVMSKSADGAW